MEEESDISINDLQLQNQLHPIDVTDDGIDTYSSEEHLLNAYDPIDFKEDGKNILINDEHS